MGLRPLSPILILLGLCPIFYLLNKVIYLFENKKSAKITGINLELESATPNQKILQFQPRLTRPVYFSQ